MPFRKLIFGVALFSAVATMAANALAVDIVGAGATFPYPIYAKWAEAYKAKTVDFGASDKPLTPEELNKSGLIQFPAIIGGVVPIVNIEGVKPGEMKLTGIVLADIFLGKVKTWGDKAITDLNPGLKLANDPITVVRRSDGSGTTFLFTDYLSKVSSDWKAKVGADAAVAWPEGVGGKGNEGVSAYVQRKKGSIGYVEYAYAKKNKMSYTQLKNKDGQFVQPDDPSFQAAAAYADWAKAPGFFEILTDEPGKNSWPITGASFILVYKTQADAAKGAEVLRFFEWALKNGQKMAEEMDYVPRPARICTSPRSYHWGWCCSSSLSSS